MVATSGASTRIEFQPATKRITRAGIDERMTVRNSHDTPSDNGTATNASSTLSTSDSRTTRPRLDPRARRTAISRPRSDPRASSRLAILAHAMNSTKSAAACHSTSTRSVPSSPMPRLIG